MYFSQHTLIHNTILIYCTLCFVLLCIYVIIQSTDVNTDCWKHGTFCAIIFPKGGPVAIMEIGNRINQLRKLSGMTQEQLAEKLHVSRQTISKWESGVTMPDLESVVLLSRMFHISLDDLMLEEEMKEKDNKIDETITLEDLMQINLHTRNMMMLLTGGLLFLMVCILSVVFIMALQHTTLSTQYMLYRYIAVGEYANIPVNYLTLLLPAIASGIIGLVLCACYFVKSRKNYN